jgi:hypothetical protein
MEIGNGALAAEFPEVQGNEGSALSAPLHPRMCPEHATPGALENLRRQLAPVAQLMQ